MKTPRYIFIALITLALVAMAATVTSAVASSPTFGDHGRVLTSFPGGSAEAAGVDHDSQGRLIVAGKASNGTNNDLAVVRYMPDGQLDQSFGIGGRAITDLGAFEKVTDVAVDSQDRIAVAAETGPTSVYDGAEALVVRYLPNGQLDPGFANGGVARLGEPSSVWALAVDSADRVIVSGGADYTDRGLGPNGEADPNAVVSVAWDVARLTASGTLDPSFGGGDGLMALTSESEFFAKDVTVDRSGRILVATHQPEEAESPSSGVAHLSVVRVTADGTVDKSFGRRGMKQADFSDGEISNPSIAVDARGRIVVAGAYDNWHAARFLPNGNVDPSFSKDGQVSLSMPRDDEMTDIAFDIRQRVVLGGWQSVNSGISGPYRFLLTRLRGDGGRDRSFGRNGFAAIGFGTGKARNSQAAALTVVGNTTYLAGSVLPLPRGSVPARFAVAGYAASP